MVPTGTFQSPFENRFRFTQITHTQKLISSYMQMSYEPRYIIWVFFHKYLEAIGIIAPLSSNQETDMGELLSLVSYVFPWYSFHSFLL